jgi:hopene-associated glycosyltransferase HpnB
MHIVGLTIGAICSAAWLYLLAAHGGFWRVGRSRSPMAPVTSWQGTVAVVIPARDEAPVIGNTVQALLQQSLAPSIRVFVVDDQSTDGTANAARKAGDQYGSPQQVFVIPGQPLPPGWTGKVWAVQQGIAAATASHPNFLLLTDADISHSPTNVATLIALAESGPYDLTSFMVKLQCTSLAEKLLIPAFVFFFFMLYPPDWIRNPRRKTAGAAGGCMLVRPEALQRAGGIEVIRDQIIDDCALARVIKRSGGRLWLGVTPDTHSTRAYGSFAEIEHMISRTAFNQLQHSTALLIGSLVGLGIVYLAPVILLLSGSPLLMAVGAACWLIMAFAYVPMARFYGLSAAWALTLPFSSAFYMFATVHSAVKYWAGRGGEWKGRAQDI